MLITIIDLIFQVYTVMLIGRIISSWLPEYRENAIVLFIAYYTDPYLNLFRRFIPPIGMIDISPMIAFLCLGFIQQAVKQIIFF